MAKSDEVPQLTAERVAEFKEHLAGTISGAERAVRERARLCFDQAWADINFCLEHPIGPPKTPVGMVRSMDAAKILDRMQKRRNKLIGIKIACIRAKSDVEAIAARARAWLIMQPEIRGLKNDSLRGAAMRKITGRLDDILSEIKALVDAVDSLFWNLKDNQHAMDLAYREITWIQKSSE